MQWLAALCVRAPGLRVGAHPRHRASSASPATRSSASIGSRRSTSRSSSSRRALPGAAPEEVETEITDKIEEAVNTISGIDELRSISTEGVSQVIVTFVAREGRRRRRAGGARPRQRGAAATCPKDIDQPDRRRSSIPTRRPILCVALRGQDHAVREITEFADKRVRRAARERRRRRPGAGRRRPQAPDQRAGSTRSSCARASVTVADVQRAIARAERDDAGRPRRHGPRASSPLRIHGRVDRPERDRRHRRPRRTAGHPIRVRDVGERRGRRGGRATRGAAQRRAHGRCSPIRKQSGTNTVAGRRRASRSASTSCKQALPAGYDARASCATTRTSSGRASTPCRSTSSLGALLAALVVLLFLGNVRCTIIAAHRDPDVDHRHVRADVVAGLHAQHRSRCSRSRSRSASSSTTRSSCSRTSSASSRRRAMPPMQAAVDGDEGDRPRRARDDALAHRDLPARSRSWAASRALPEELRRHDGVRDRRVAARQLHAHADAGGALAQAKRRGGHEAARRARRRRRSTGRSSAPTCGVLAFVDERTAGSSSSPCCVDARLVRAARAGAANKGFLPVNDEAQFEVSVRAPEGTSLDATRAHRASASRARSATCPRSTHTLVTDRRRRRATRTNLATHLRAARRSRARATRRRTTSMDRVRTRDPREAADTSLRIDRRRGRRASAAAASRRRASSTPCAGPTSTKLESDRERRRRRSCKKVPGAVDVDTIAHRRQARDRRPHRPRSAPPTSACSVADVADALRLLVGGDKVSTYDEQRRAVRRAPARRRAQYRADAGGARAAHGARRRGSAACRSPTSSTLDARHRARRSINRLEPRSGRSRSSRTPRPAYGDGHDRATRCRTIIDDEHLPAGYAAAPTGPDARDGRAARASSLAFVLSFVFMYLILAAQFESWLHPITILLVAAADAAVRALVASSSSSRRSTSSRSLGILVLFGVVKKNAILQIDHTNQLRERGHAARRGDPAGEPRPAAADPDDDVAFVAGMIPLVLSSGVGAGFNRATAGVVVGGQILSLFLTLLATPVAYSLFDDLANFLRRVFRMKPAERLEPDANPAE